MNINLVDSQLFDLVGKLLSCMVSVLMVFQYFDTKYIRTYHSRIFYIIVKTICCLINLAVYRLNSPLINISFWLIMVLLVSKCLYYDERSNKVKYYLINIAFILALSTCESVGCILVDTSVKFIGIDQEESIVSFVYTIGGSASAILLYYLILKRLFINEKTKRITVSQYTIYAVITAYVLINIGEILFLIKHELSNKDYVFLMIDAVFLILINLYLFYMLDTYTENKDLKYKLALYERQAQSNYEYYAKQIESQKTAMAVIHDIRKHIRVMEELKQLDTSLEMQSYTDSFENMITPLLVRQYCSNPILNIIINDKVDYCMKNGIRFEVDIQEVLIDYMKPIDITTIFGNILDNAIDASKKADRKEIVLKVHPFNEFIYIQLSNRFSGKIKWSTKGRPLTSKGEQHGIGLENVEKVLRDYNGNMEFSVNEQIFTVEIMISHP